MDLAPSQALLPPLASPGARGRRLKAVRKMLRMTIKEFAALCGSGMSTICQWEQGHLGGFVEKSARSVVRALQKTELVCSEDWLLFEHGIEPYFKKDEQKVLAAFHTAQLVPSSGTLLDLKTEMETFCKKDTSALILHLQDDAMAPWFKIGDYVGGQRVPPALVEQLIGDAVMVQTVAGQTLIRRLDSRSASGTYRLSATNPQTTAEPYVLDEELVSIAVITRLWRSFTPSN